MKTINLLTPSQSEVPFERFVFPDGQDHIKVSITDTSPVKVITPLRNASDLFVLLQLTDILKHNSVDKIHLVITYLLSARMDRRMSSSEAISLKIVTDIINSQKYRSVEVYDPHSEITLTLLNRAKSSSKNRFLSFILSKIDNPLLISPDAGAAKKCEDIAKEYHLDTIFCTKSRSTATGYISKVTVGAEDLRGRNCLIVDDICDGGATFVNLAKELKAKNAGKLYLAVSHGIFSKGVDALADYEAVFTTNSYQSIHHPKLTIYNLW